MITSITLDVIKDWLRSQHTTLWQDWYVTDPQELEEAAQWLEGVFLDLAAFAAGQQS